MFEPVRALPTVAVSDMDRAKQFYGDVLGLKVDQERPDGVLYEAGGGSLILVYVSQFGVVRGGARRWIDLGGVSLQPSEFARLTMALVLAMFYGESRRSARSMAELAIGAALLAVPV